MGRIPRTGSRCRPGRLPRRPPPLRSRHPGVPGPQAARTGQADHRPRREGPGQDPERRLRREDDRYPDIVSPCSTRTSVAVTTPKSPKWYRPGHADLCYDLKYGFRDYRGGGRSSARETIGRVAPTRMPAPRWNRNSRREKKRRQHRRHGPSRRPQRSGRTRRTRVRQTRRAARAGDAQHPRLQGIRSRKRFCRGPHARQQAQRRNLF